MVWRSEMMIKIFYEVWLNSHFVPLVGRTMEFYVLFRHSVNWQKKIKYIRFSTHKCFEIPKLLKCIVDYFVSWKLVFFNVRFILHDGKFDVEVNTLFQWEPTNLFWKYEKHNCFHVIIDFIIKMSKKKCFTFDASHSKIC